jgi:hypothetical protein
MQERSISLHDAAECFFNPDKVRSTGNEIALFKLIDGKVVILICLEKDMKYRIITAIKSSKIEKYL